MIAYNKIDLPDSGDYIEEVREFLLGRGLALEDVHAMSAVTGQGVLGVVRRARELLDQLPSEVSTDLPVTSCVHSLVFALEDAHAMSAAEGQGVLGGVRGARELWISCQRGEQNLLSAIAHP